VFTDCPGYQNVVVKLILPAELLVRFADMAAGADRAAFSPELIALETHTANWGARCDENATTIRSRWRRRHALNMARQPPENVNDALVILDLLREQVVTFLHVDMPEPAKAPVMMLVRPRPDLSA
jgi:hypothetical protein